jgi:lysozyme family protein
MADLKIALDVLLRHEGGYAPSDNARGSVNFGWTAASLKGLGLPHTDADVRALTRERAAGLYAVHFWTPLRLNEVRDQKLATLIFSMAVNMGPGRAVRFLQKALNDDFEDRGATTRLAVDGKIGPKTILAINGMEPAHLILKFKAYLAGEYRRLAEAKPELYADDLKGWLRRLEELTA